MTEGQGTEGHDFSRATNAPPIVIPRDFSPEESALRRHPDRSQGKNDLDESMQRVGI